MKEATEEEKTQQIERLRRLVRDTKKSNQTDEARKKLYQIRERRHY